MKKYENIAYGITLTILIYLVSVYLNETIHLPIEFISPSFILHSSMGTLSIISLYIFKDSINYNISVPEFRKIIRPILFGLLVTVLANSSMNIAIKFLGENIEEHPLITSMSAIQVFIFVFIYASIAEELLFRGVLLNFLEPLKKIGFNFFKRKISLPVLISALAFGLGHLVLVFTGVQAAFLVRVVVFTTLLGIVAGYYQEKYDNNAYAIIVHMAGNSIGVIGVLLMNSDA